LKYLFILLPLYSCLLFDGEAIFGVRKSNLRFSSGKSTRP
jgi:hypothetical protein